MVVHIKTRILSYGRSILYKEQGENLLLRLIQDLDEFGKVEQMPKLEGKRMTIYLSPKTIKKGK